MRWLFSSLFFVLAFLPKGFSQKEKKCLYLENTISLFNIVPQPASGFKPAYWMSGSMNSIMVKAGLNTTHIFRLGLTDYGNLSWSPIYSFIFNNEKVEYELEGYDLRLGYQYNFKNDKRKTVPFLSANYLFTKYEEHHEYWIDNGASSSFTNIEGHCILFSIGAKQKIGRILVVNIESEILFGNFNSSGRGRFRKVVAWEDVDTYFTVHKRNFTAQFYPIKIYLGVRLWDYKQKKI